MLQQARDEIDRLARRLRDRGGHVQSDECGQSDGNEESKEDTFVDDGDVESDTDERNSSRDEERQAHTHHDVDSSHRRGTWVRSGEQLRRRLVAFLSEAFGDSKAWSGSKGWGYSHGGLTPRNHLQRWSRGEWHRGRNGEGVVPCPTWLLSQLDVLTEEFIESVLKEFLSTRVVGGVV